jgi:signal transduction histidine kinase/ligand-binding sensor domain-containing protein/DNA-binding response OmpR family regulator
MKLNLSIMMNQVMKRIILSLLFLHFVLLPVQSLYFRNYQVESGLSHNSVWAVMQDKQGFMWFGTNNGLNRFDGKNFKIYRQQSNDSLSIGHDFIHCIKEDSKGRLLIGTRNGMYLYNRDQDNFSPVVFEKGAINVNDILEDLNGNIWVACHGEGLYRLNTALIFEKHYLFDDTFSNFIWTIATDHNGNLWLGAAGKGLAHFDIQNERCLPITDRENLYIENQTIYTIHCDRDNSLWIGTSTNGLFRYNYINNDVSHYLKNTGSIKSIHVYSEQELIMGSEKGLVIFNKHTGNYNIIKENESYDNASDNSIFSIAQDNEGAFWIGTYYGGVNYFSPAIHKFLYFNNFSKKTYQKHIISSIVEEEDGKLLVATHNNNIIYRYDPVNRETGKAFEMDYNNIQCLLRDNDRLYVSIYGRGIYVLSLKTGKIVEKISTNTIEGKSMFKISTGKILISLEEGGCVLKDSNGKLTPLKKLSGIQITDITEDTTQTIWFATHAYGLYCWKPDGSWENFTNTPNSKIALVSNGLSDLLCDSKNYLWIGTKNKGLILYNPAERKIEREWNETSGLPSNTIYSILDDAEGNVWVSTQKGIVRISNRNFEIKTFGYIGQEIQYNSRCALISSSNYLYFGGANGFISLNPEELVFNKKIPTIAITEFKIFNKKVLPGEKSSPLKNPVESATDIVLKHNQSNFSFEFASFSFVSPSSNQYAYMLDGFENNWNYVTENTAHYMNIPPGKYVFKVKGTNNDGLWGPEKCILIKIKPPFWLETYMIILYILALTGAIIYLILRYHKHLEAKNQEKQYKYHVAKEKEIYESKINFFTNIAHEIRTPLSLIMAPLERIIASKNMDEEVKKNLGIVELNANRLLDLVNQLLDFRKIENDMFLLNFHYQNVVKIIRKIYDQYHQDAKNNRIEMTLDVPANNILCYIDSEALYKIVSNLISNALKFTKDSIRVQLTIDDETLLLSVEDNGNGIKECYLNKIFEPFYQIQVTDNYNNKGSGLGLSLSKTLAMKLGGDLYVQSEYGKGSLFTLELPVLKNEDISKEDKEIAEEITSESMESVRLDSSQTILLVEDNNELRNFMKECLSEYYTVVDANNGVHALQVIENNAVDIIISDILMPEMDGLELAHELKSNAAYSHLPIILLSAKTDTATKIDGFRKGADVYMEKPFSIEQLKAQISSIIETRINLRKKLIESPLQYFKRNNINDDESAKFVKKLNDFIVENMSDEKFSINNLSRNFAISRTNFQKKIKSITGLTPNDYIKLIRLNKSAELLSTGKYRINEVCVIVGFNTPSYFSRCFFEHFGKLPKDFAQTNIE